MRRPNNKVLSSGQPQFWVGVNFWSRTGGPLMWRHYDPKVIREELDAMKAHGMTLTRSFFYWPDFMPTPERLDETLVERFIDFLDAHQERGMSSIPTFLVGHMSGQNWDPAWRNGRDLFEDVWFVARQAWYCRELTARTADHPAVAAWLLTNEVPIYGDWKSRGNGALRAESVISWAQILIDAVRAGGGYQPISIGEGAWGVEINGSDNGFRVRDIAKIVDFLGPHVYRMETDQVRQHLGAAFVCELLHDFERPARGHGGVRRHERLHERRECRALLPSALAPHAARGRHRLDRLEQHRLRRPLHAGALQPSPLRAALRARRQTR